MHVHRGEPRGIHAEETSPGRRQRPLAARVGLDLDPVAGHRRRQPPAGVLLVQIAGLEGQQVHFVPGQRQEGPRGIGVQPGPLAEGDLAGRVADVVAEHAAHEQVGRGAVAPLCKRFHGCVLSERPLPPPRTAWISARIASAISGADRAPRSRPIGT